MKTIAPHARDDGADDFVWIVTFAAWYDFLREMEKGALEAPLFLADAGCPGSLIPSSKSNDSLDTHPVIPDAPQHHFGGAVLIRDPKRVNT